ncbi:MAG: methylenetetrahydrofolate reductase [Candidatus Omnitrophica bacterium]|nr:methylenetetrahydrofolate reductase [Candidatus Omnitrophota bacterium]
MLRDKIEKGEFVFTLEVSPPRGVNIEKAIQPLNSLKDKFDAFNVTDCPGAKLRLSSLAMSYFLKQRGFEAVMQITARDRNSLALQADLLAASAYGIENVLALTGDPPFVGRNTKAKAVFEIDAIGILEIMQNLNQGCSWEGEEIKGSTNFFAAAAVNPGAVRLDKEIERMKKKIDKGAKFFYTQAVFDIENFKRFMDKISRIKIPLIAGIIVLRSERMAKFINDNIPGINIPPSILSLIEESSDKRRASLAIAEDIVNKIKDMVQGVHIMPIGYNSVVEELIERVR